MCASPLLELRGVSKAFGATKALTNVDFEVEGGEVHVLAGENGAGKSTLIRIVCGVYADFDGTLLFDGQPRFFRSPQQASAAGILPIHQELSLIGPMTVADNLLLGEMGPLLGPISYARRRELARQRLTHVGLDLDPDQLVETLPLAVRQLIEIARALARRSRLLVMDEPTSALTESAAERLFSQVRELKARGTAVIYISHRLEEIYRLADRISVLRDGARVLTARADELAPGELVKEMVGRSVSRVVSAPAAHTDEALLAVEELSVQSRPPLHGVSFELRRGEVLGVFGLQGSGASTLLHALCGALPGIHGGVSLSGAPLDPKSPREALARGVVLLSGDRQTSVFSELSILHNSTLSSLRRFSRFSYLLRARELGAARDVARRLSLAVRAFDAPARTLSGGNQQKVALGRCLLSEPKLLLLDDPTRGIDVGAKADIYRLIQELSRAGAGILLVTSEMEELTALSHRILVLFRGRPVGMVEHAGFERARLLSAAMGSATELSP